MTRKDFQGLALVLYTQNAPPRLIDAIADWCELQSTAFDRFRFLLAAKRNANPRT